MSGSTRNSYIAEGIELGIRSDGRSCLDCRPLELELGLIAQANGSARLHLGRTDVIVGIKVRLRVPAAARWRVRASASSWWGNPCSTVLAVTQAARQAGS